MFGGITRDRDTENTGSSSPDLLERTADLYSVYLTIPCLQEISLEAVKYYHRRRVYNETLCYNPRSGNSRIQSDELYKEIWKFDTVWKQWRLLDVANTPPYAASNCCNLIGYNPRSGNSRIQSDELYKEIWKFDTVRKQWRLLDVANTPPYAASNCCNLIGNKILTIFGGTSYPFGEESGNDLYVLDLNEEKKFNIVTGGEKDENEKPPGRYGQGVVIKDNYLYAIGGTTGYVYSMDVHRLNLSANRWELLYNSDLFGPGDPEPRYRHEVVLYEDHIYVLGGGTELKVFNLEDIHSYDTLSRTWVLHHTNPDPIHLYPSPRKCHGLVQLPSTPSIVYILGGADGALVLNDVWRLDLARLQWTKIEMSLTARVYFHAVTVTPHDKVYMFGGITRDRDTENTGSSSPDLLERTADLYSVYLTIPCLQEISLEAVKYYHRRRVYNETLCASYANGISSWEFSSQI
ncbi:kelch domain-containing protein 10-like [Diaphorina citri]|uniref:Kelch domain-containing protein 10-like n=1 Tax=Diaphorina citri TaxID=121845 RepID=A0A1S3DCV3_DIACI|nr:kelch domain-containing protein 10-like [Diaphorina citri]